MRYLSLILFAGFLVFSVDFATQNTELVVLHYRLDWLNFSYQSERPVFVPVFFTFAFGIIFSVFYFFFYHAVLLRNLRKQKKEIKRLNRLVETEREKHGTMEVRNSELQQIVERVQDRVVHQDDLEPLILEDKEYEK
ncbi:MAG TPA: LapA family protein [Deltaproteobacteria bacterium]|nr:LapA family protein [SAR324 cluster bacterium]HHZ78949.1 LapA family protein [Candidatus Lambdaproteobacteria bacterium]HIB93572.1 LapA family protein [Candidatus Lambdaproteobacteria bacterium]HIN46853.1 LapA family protein [Deltaproteobacteria bacterium]HIO83882.1 LapA family protein [Deltaproteobacteria bacterium]